VACAGGSYALCNARTAGLLDRLKASARARIITTASGAHQGAHIPFDDVNAERSYRSH
jgi:hypothetical protein